MWISTKDKLPEVGKWVLVYVNSAIVDNDPNCKIKVMCLEYGISNEERLAMKSSNDPKLRERSKSYGRSDQFGNNLVNYSWIGKGSCHYDGQNALYWCEIPELPKYVIDKHNRVMEEQKNPIDDPFWNNVGLIAIKKMFESIN